MAVENVHEPKRTQKIDPHTQGEKKDEDTTYWENAVKSTRAKREFLQEQKMMQDISEPPAPPEPPFKVTGGINMGTIDLQEQQRLAREEAQKAQELAQQRIDSAIKEKDAAQKALHDATLEHVRETLGGQIEQLRAAIVSGGKRDIISELEGIEVVAQRLGLQRGPTTGSDIQAQIELKRLEQELKREDRRFAQEMKKDERLWQLEIKKLEQSSREADARLQAEKERYAMLASIPEQLGTSIAKGLIARGDPNAQPVSGAVSSQVKSKKKQPYKVQAGAGEAGEVECPNCKTPVGIGPTAAKAVCVGCRSEFTVERVSPPSGSPPPEPGPNASEEEVMNYEEAERVR